MLEAIKAIKIFDQYDIHTAGMLPDIRKNRCDKNNFFVTKEMPLVF